MFPMTARFDQYCVMRKYRAVDLAARPPNAGSKRPCFQIQLAAKTAKHHPGGAWKS
jgi:hypothetical protein